MPSITLVRHPLQFYLVQFISFMMICGIGCGIASRGVLKINSRSLLNRADYLALAIGIVFVFLAFYMTFKFFKNTPIIRADESSIRFGKLEIYALEDIREIKFTGKVPLSVLWSFPVEGTCLLLKNGTKKYIYGDFYSNAPVLKSFLSRVVVNMDTYEPSFPQGKAGNADLGDMEFFKGNPLLSFSAITLWGLIAFNGFVAFKMAQRDEPWIIMVGITIFVFIALSFSMNYFGLSDNYFIIKNHYYIWKKHVHRIDNIYEIVFETSPRGPNFLRINTQDFQSKIYPASSLREKHWLALKSKFQDKGVLVRDECIKPNS